MVERDIFFSSKGVGTRGVTNRGCFFSSKGGRGVSVADSINVFPVRAKTAPPAQDVVDFFPIATAFRQRSWQRHAGTRAGTPGRRRRSPEASGSVIDILDVSK